MVSGEAFTLFFESLLEVKVEHILKCLDGCRLLPNARNAQVAISHKPHLLLLLRSVTQTSFAWLGSAPMCEEQLAEIEMGL